MKIKLIVVAKTEEAYLKAGIDIYLKRIIHYVPFEIVEIPAIKNAGKISVKTQKQLEGALILKHLDNTDALVLLDEQGKEFTSVGYSNFLGKKLNSGIKTLTFVIGGPFGFSEAVYAKATDKMALSQMTFSHQMVRLFFVEQLYRALNIIHGGAYHHE